MTTEYIAPRRKRPTKRMQAIIDQMRDGVDADRLIAEEERRRYRRAVRKLIDR